MINGVIQDEWDQVIINCQEGKADKYYSAGDYLPIQLSGISGTYHVEYVGSAYDIRADGSNRPVTTWAFKDIPTTSVWNSNGKNAGGWKSSDIRSHCRTVIFNALPNEIRDNIVEVKKQQMVLPLLIMFGSLAVGTGI